MERVVGTPQVGQTVRLAGISTQPHWDGLQAKVLAVNPESRTLSVLVNFTKEQPTSLIIGPRQFQPDTAPVAPKVYLVTHPLRYGKLTLLPDGLVTWTHILKPGIFGEESAPHGSWFMEGQTLIVNFHHQGVQGKEFRHAYVEMNPGSDVWHLAGHFHAQNAVDFAILEPTQSNCPWFRPKEETSSA